MPLPSARALMSMSTRCTHTNSAGHSGQPNAPSGSGTQPPNAAPQNNATATPQNNTTTSQTSNATPIPLAKPQLQHIKYEVPLLDNNGDDYIHWCKMVSLVLEHRGFWDVVDGTTPTPDYTANHDAYL